jgi:hypothetical protein
VRELVQLLNTEAGTQLREDDPRARATVSARMAGMDGKPATPDEMREAARGVALIYEPHMITLVSLFGPKWLDHQARARAALRAPPKQSSQQTAGQRRAARHAARRSGRTTE